MGAKLGSEATAAAAATKQPATQQPAAAQNLAVHAGIGSVGIFAEEREKSSVNIFKQVQKRKLLSSVEQAGLLT